MSNPISIIVPAQHLTPTNMPSLLSSLAQGLPSAGFDTIIIKCLSPNQEPANPDILKYFQSRQDTFDLHSRAKPVCRWTIPPISSGTPSTVQRFSIKCPAKKKTDTIRLKESCHYLGSLFASQHDTLSPKYRLYSKGLRHLVFDLLEMAETGSFGMIAGYPIDISGSLDQMFHSQALGNPQKGHDLFLEFMHMLRGLVPPNERIHNIVINRLQQRFNHADPLFLSTLIELANKLLRAANPTNGPWSLPQ